MFAFTYSAAILSIVNLGFAAFLFILYWRKNKKQHIIKYLILLLVTSAIWLLGNAISDITTNFNDLVLWGGIALIAGNLTMASYLCIVEYFVYERISKCKFIIFFLPVIIMSLFAFTKYNIYDAIFPFNKPAISITGELYWVVLSYIFFTWFYSLIIVIKKIKTATTIQRAQINYIFFGFAFQFVGAIICTFILPFMGNNSYFTLSPQFIIFLNGAIAYAILKHRLIDVKIIIQKSLVYSLIIIVVVGIYLLIISLITSLITLTGIKYHFIASLFAALFGAIGVPPLKKYLKRKTDKIFFKDRVPYADAVHALSSAMNLSLDLHDLLKRTAETLCTIFKPNEIKIFLNRENILLHKKNSHNSRITILSDAEFEILPADDDSMLVNAEYDSITLAQVFIGEKLSGDIYLPEDRQILQTFSGQFAMALQKTFYYEKMKKHAEKLENLLSNKK